jgi:ABC-2 type transport system permease protein
VTGLIRAEILRFASRRLFRMLGVLVIAGLLAAAVIAFLQSSKDPDAGRAEAQRIVAQCERDIAEVPPPQQGEGFRCPRVEDIAGEIDKRFVYARSMPDATRGVAIAFFILAFVVSASFVGADWASGSTTTLLTWEPRRGRVFAAKVVAASILIAVAAVLTLAFLDVVFLPVAALRGTTEGLDGSVWWTLAGVWLRGSGIAVFGAVVGAAIATITRNTAGAVGVAFGYGVVLENLLSVIRGGRLQPWLLQNLFARVLGIDVRGPSGPISNLRPTVLLPIYGIAVLAAGYAALRTRDVT